ncbi:hypothetical protein GXM_09068 [Nostoc sphaeroides CCNUC1]|uniref:Uncharacterized protein n=1 Tax=Nostoc sphaeroides CCNUC1 TaxID=2653204 RepID=A0A5P8WFW6_9NOSO|nr:hypothetical protein GXM_08838 [Nostoc sphaeroides CCNUC1]QFS51574.1 hypothetical protein GXM_09068 [Nostoc sphaeroides CCNUC1]
MIKSNFYVKFTGKRKSWVCIATKTGVFINFIYRFYSKDFDHLLPLIVYNSCIERFIAKLRASYHRVFIIPCGRRKAIIDPHTASMFRQNPTFTSKTLKLIYSKAFQTILQVFTRISAQYLEGSASRLPVSSEEM